MKRYLLFVIMFAVAMAAWSQSAVRTDGSLRVMPDSADIAYYTRPHFLQGAATLVGLNTAVWAYDRFLEKGEFSKVTLNSIASNFREGFNWDNDYLSTNMFLHPYHGNLYFNIGRSNGFNYWQSGLFALAGSAMWEFIYECEYPSTNDIIATPIGGMAIGEVTFRASDIVLKDNTRGWQRFGREAAGFLISPMRGLTRIINGDAWRYRPTTGRVFGIPNINLELSLGVRAIGVKRKVFDCGAGVGTEVNVEYGDRFEEASSQPYDYFKFKLRLNFERSQPLLGQLNIMGRLVSRNVVEAPKDVVNLGLYQHYDFYDSDTLSVKTDRVPYRLGIPASVGAGVMYRNTHISGVTLDAYAHTNAIILGGVLSDHYEIKDRNYNLASGFSIKSGINALFGKDKLSIAAGYDYYRLFTWGYPRSMDIYHHDPRTINAQGDDSVAYFAIASLRADVRVASHLYLTGAFSVYMRGTRYRDFPNVHSDSYSTRMMLTYEF